MSTAVTGLYIPRMHVKICHIFDLFTCLDLIFLSIYSASPGHRKNIQVNCNLTFGGL